MKKLRVYLAIFASFVMCWMQVMSPYAAFASQVSASNQSERAEKNGSGSSSDSSQTEWTGDDANATRPDNNADGPQEPLDDGASTDDASSASSSDSTQGNSDEKVENSFRYKDGKPIVSKSANDGISVMKSDSDATGWGIDVSEHNGNVNWNAVKVAGCSFAIIRTSFAGGNTGGRLDYKWERNVSECERLGIPYGVYVYSYAETSSDALDEANYVINALKGRSISLPVYYDLEDKCLPKDQASLLKLTQTFCDKIKQAGYIPGVYSNLNWWTNKLTSSAYNQYRRWVAQYNYQCDYKGSYDIWQYSSNVKIPGCSGVFDANYCYGTYLPGLAADDLASEHKDDLKDGLYSFAVQSAQSSVIAPENSSKNNSARIVLSSLGDDDTVIWKVSHNGNYVTLQNYASGRYLDVDAGRAYRGAVVQQYAGNGSRAQKWIAIKNSDGSYTLRSGINSMLSLDLPSGSTAVGTKLQLWTDNGSSAQKYVLKTPDTSAGQSKKMAAEHKNDLEDGTYTIESAKRSQGVLDAQHGGISNGTKVQLYGSNKTDAQVWNISHDGDYVVIKNAKSGLSLDIPGGNASPRVQVQLYSANSSLAQKWIAVKDADGYFTFHSALRPSLVLDLTSGATVNGTLVQIYGNNGTAAQNWSLSKTTSTRERLDKSAQDNKGVLSDGSYLMVPASDDSFALTVSGGPAKLASLSKPASSAWKVSHDDNGYVTFTNADGKALYVSNASASNGSSLDVHVPTGSFAEKWIVSKKTDGTMSICSALADDMVIDISGGSINAGTKTWLYQSNGSAAQQWSFTDVSAVQKDIDSLAQANKNTVPDGDYAILFGDMASRIVMDVQGGSTQNNANVQLYGSNGTVAQRWHIKNEDSGYVTITSVKSGLALDVSGASSSVGANIQLHTCNGTPAQQWIIKKNDNGSFSIISALWSNRYLGGQKKSVAARDNVQLCNNAKTDFARATFIKSKPDPAAPSSDTIDSGSWFTLSANNDSSQCVDVAGASKGDGANVQMHGANKTFAQLFTFKYENGFYRIINANSNRPLNVAEGDVVPGANVQQYFSNDDNVLFSAQKNSDGTYSFINKATGLMLSASKGNVCVTTPSGSASQKFSLNKVTDLVAPGSYSIVSGSNNNICLDVASASPRNDANVDVYSSNGTFAQRWMIARVDGRDNTYTIESLCSGLRLGSNGAGDVRQFVSSDSDSQYWIPQISYGSVQLVNASSKQALSMDGVASGKNVKTSALSSSSNEQQNWNLIACSADIPNGCYTLRLVADSTKVIDAHGGNSSNGTNIQVYAANNSGAQKYNVTRNGDGSYTFKNAASGKALDVTNGNRSAGANIQFWDSNGSDAQKWFVTYDRGGFKLASKLNRNLVLGSANNSFSNGSNVQLCEDHANSAQRFTFLATTYTPPVTVQYHNIAWAGQPNNYYCGPTSGYMILRNRGLWRSSRGTGLSIDAVASYMGTKRVGFTSFNNRAFQNGMNARFGRNVYTTIANPSYGTVKDYVLRSYKNGYATAFDEHERRGGPHLNGHNNGTFSHIMVVDGYDARNDSVLFVDPGAGTVWGGSRQKFWYGSLRSFTYNFLGKANWRDGIGMYAAR